MLVKSNCGWMADLVERSGDVAAVRDAVAGWVLGCEVTVKLLHSRQNIRPHKLGLIKDTATQRRLVPL